MVRKLAGYSINQNDKKVLFMTEDGKELPNLQELIKKHGLFIVDEILEDSTIPLHPDTWRTFLREIVHAMMFPDLGPEYKQDEDGKFIGEFENTVKEVTDQINSVDLSPPKPIIPEHELEGDEEEPDSE